MPSTPRRTGRDAPVPTGLPRRARLAPAALALAAALAALAAGCADEPRTDPAPLDRFAWPVGLAVHGQDLFVASSNFDLRFAEGDGGSLLRVALGDAPAIQPDGRRIASFAGEVAVADAAQCGLPRSEVLVTARRGRMYRMPIADGALTCGEGCELRLDQDARRQDPYGVAVTCPPAGPKRAWTAYLRTADGGGALTSVDLATGEQKTVAIVGGTVRSFAYDAEADRLFFTGPNSGLTAPVRWIDLAGGCAIDALESQGGCPLRGFDLWPALRGAELAGIAISNPLPDRPRRLYLMAKVFDADLAATLGVRPAFDFGGKLLVVEIASSPGGDPRLDVVRIVDDNVGLGASEVRVLPPRPGGVRDLVALTASEDGNVWIYDDETGAMRDVFRRDATTGRPVLGRAPFGLAVQDLRPAGAGEGSARVFVGSFEDDFVTAIDVPLQGGAPATIVSSPAAPGVPMRIGQVTP